MKVWTTTVKNDDWEDRGTAGPLLSRKPTPDEAVALMLDYYDLTREDVSDVHACDEDGIITASARLLPGWGYCEIIVPRDPAEIVDPADRAAEEETG